MALGVGFLMLLFSAKLFCDGSFVDMFWFSLLEKLLNCCCFLMIGCCGGRDGAGVLKLKLLEMAVFSYTRRWVLKYYVGL